MPGAVVDRTSDMYAKAHMNDWVGTSGATSNIMVQVQESNACTRVYDTNSPFSRVCSFLNSVSYFDDQEE